MEIATVKCIKTAMVIFSHINEFKNSSPETNAKQLRPSPFFFLFRTSNIATDVKNQWSVQRFVSLFMENHDIALLEMKAKNGAPVS